MLVQCHAGKSRSASVVLAYLMKYKNMGFGTAMAYLKQRRPRVNPNVGFIEQLKLY